MNPTNQPCPCGLEASFDDCCGRFLKRLLRPQTCEALMRSRYTAFTLADISYIRHTMKGRALLGFNAQDTQAFALAVDWQVLTVFRAHQSRKFGEVEFCAKYTENGASGQIHEVSEFFYDEGQWYYVGGKNIF